MNDRRGPFLESVRKLERESKQQLKEARQRVRQGRQKALPAIEREALPLCRRDADGFARLAMEALKKAADLQFSRVESAEVYDRMIHVAKAQRTEDVPFLLRMRKRTDDALTTFALAHSTLLDFYEEAHRLAKSRVDEAA